ncbi:Equilibrative nucleotide transporter 2 [Camellia lanceoleosa]|nr:Equilibrative nucleotide transporter 2 [Camellia lanceoleosa]
MPRNTTSPHEAVNELQPLHNRAPSLHYKDCVCLEKYHPSRVLTLVYQPFALGTLAILTYREAKINTRRRNLFGYIIFSTSALAVLVLDLATSRKGRIGTYIGICIISGAFGVADAYVQGGMVGDLSLMLPEFLQVIFVVSLLSDLVLKF